MIEILYGIFWNIMGIRWEFHGYTLWQFNLAIEHHPS